MLFQLQLCAVHFVFVSGSTRRDRNENPRAAISIQSGSIVVSNACCNPGPACSGRIEDSKLALREACTPWFPFILAISASFSLSAALQTFPPLSS